LRHRTGVEKRGKEMPPISVVPWWIFRSDEQNGGRFALVVAVVVALKTQWC
jgi:hypothetical protein